MTAANANRIAADMMLARAYEPELSTPGSIMTVAVDAITTARFVPMGLFIVVQLDITFTAGGTAEEFVIVTMPTPIRPGTVIGWSPGFIIGMTSPTEPRETSVAYKTASGSVNTVAIGPGFGSKWRLAGDRRISGMVMYEQDR